MTLTPRDPARIDRILERLRVAWSQKDATDLRLGQLIVALATAHDNRKDLGRVFNIEDDEMLNRIERMISENGGSSVLPGNGSPIS